VILSRHGKMLSLGGMGLAPASVRGYVLQQLRVHRAGRLAILGAASRRGSGRKGCRMSALPPPKRVSILQQGWGGFSQGAEVDVVTTDLKSSNGVLCFEGGKRADLDAEDIVWKQVTPFGHPHLRSACGLVHATN
jgi:hypothetical protein